MKKKLTGLLMAGCLVATGLVGCSSTNEAEQPAAEDQPTKGTQSQTTDQSTDSNYTEWEQTSGIYLTDQTEDELYELAKQEGKVVWYSISSRCEKIAESFMEAYPGIEVEVYDISSNELLEKVTREYNAGQRIADVVHIKDQDGSLYNEYVLENIFYNYQPEDIMSHIDSSYTEYATPIYIELTQLFYNKEAYKEGAPVDTLWDLTREEWKGKIMMQNPVDNSSLGSWMAGFVLEETAKELEELYEQEFGEALVLSEDCENAGYEFLKRLKANEPVYTTSSDEVAEAIGTPGQTNPPIGFAASSKLRKNESNGWVLEPANLLPNTGVPQINTIYVVEGAEHPNAAKLLIRYILGGADGTSKGYEPFNTLGGWPVRDDIEAVDGSVPLSELNVADFNPMEIYNIVNDVYDFWTMLP